MTRFQQILTGLLVVQLILIGFIFWPDSKDSIESSEMFPGLEPEDIVSMLIEGEDADSVMLARSEDGWVVPSADDFEANAERLDDLVIRLLEIKTGNLVAQSESSFERLQIADNDFVRRLTLTDKDGEDHVLYVGSSPSANATHVRKGGTNQVFLTDQITSWEIGSRARSWVDVVYVSIPTDTMREVVIENEQGTFEFVKNVEDDVWEIAGLGEDEEFIENNLKSMLSRLSSLHLDEPLGTEALPEYGFDKPLAVVTIIAETEEEGTQEYTFMIGGQLESEEGDGDYYVKISTSDHYAIATNYTVKDFVERDRSAFVQEKTEETESVEETE